MKKAIKNSRLKEGALGALHGWEASAAGKTAIDIAMLKRGFFCALRVPQGWGRGGGAAGALWRKDVFCRGMARAGMALALCAFLLPAEKALGANPELDIKAFISAVENRSSSYSRECHGFWNALQSAKAVAAAGATAGNVNQDTISEAKNKLKECEETIAQTKYNQIIPHAITCVENETKKYIPEAIGSDGTLNPVRKNNGDGDKDEKGDYASGSIKGVCMKAREKAKICCFNPEKCPYEHTRIARQVLQVAAPLAAAFATQIGSIKAATGKWDPYKYCQFNNIKGLMETGSATTVNMLSLMKKGCGAGEKSCVKECGGEIKDFKEDLEACFDPIAEFLGRKKGLSISEIKALLEKGFEDPTAEDPLLVYKIQLWSSQANSSPAAELKDAVNKKANDAYYGISKSPGGKNLRNGAESSDIVDCGESNRKFSHMQNTGDPALLKPFMMSFCQKVGEQTPPRKIASPLRPSLLGSPQGGADTSAAFTGSDSSPGNFKSSFPGGPGAAPAVSDDDLPLGGDDKNPGPLVGSGLTYPGGSPGGSGGGPGGGFAGSDFGGEDEEGEEDYPGEGFGSNDGYGFQPPEAWEGGAFAGGDSYGGGLAMDGPGGGDGSGFGRRKEKDSKDGGSPDLKKYLPDNLDPDMSIFQIMSDRIQEFCRENIREGCF